MANSANGGKPMGKLVNKIRKNVGKTNKVGFAPTTNSNTSSKYGKTK